MAFICISFGCHLTHNLLRNLRHPVILNLFSVFLFQRSRCLPQKKKAQQISSTLLHHPMQHHLVPLLFHLLYHLPLDRFQVCPLHPWGIHYLHQQEDSLPLLLLDIHHSDHRQCLFMGHHLLPVCLHLQGMSCLALHLVLHQYTTPLRILIDWVQERVGKEVPIHQPLQLPVPSLSKLSHLEYGVFRNNTLEVSILKTLKSDPSLN